MNEKISQLEARQLKMDFQNEDKTVGSNSFERFREWKEDNTNV